MVVRGSKASLNIATTREVAGQRVGKTNDKIP